MHITAEIGCRVAPDSARMAAVAILVLEKEAMLRIPLGDEAASMPRLVNAGTTKDAVRGSARHPDKRNVWAASS